MVIRRRVKDEGRIRKVVLKRETDLETSTGSYKDGSFLLLRLGKSNGSRPNMDSHRRVPMEQPNEKGKQKRKTGSNGEMAPTSETVFSFIFHSLLAWFPRRREARERQFASNIPHANW